MIWGYVLAEEGLQPLHALNQSQNNIPGALLVEVPRPELQGMLVKILAESYFDDAGRVVADRVLPVVEDAADHDERADGD